MMRSPLVQSWLRLLRRRGLWGALLFVTVGASGTALVLLGHPVYRAESRLRLGEPPPMSGVSPNAGFFGLLRLGGDPFANDLELIASRTLAERVVDDATLHVRLSAPRGWHRDSLFLHLGAGRATRRARFTIDWLDGAVSITSSTGGTVRGAPGERLHFGDIEAVLVPWRPGMPRRIQLSTVPHAQAARELGGRLRVERTRRDANVVRIRYQSNDPAVTERVVASVVGRFTELRTAIMQRESGETVDSLRGVAARAKLDLAAAEAALEAVQRSTGLVAPEAQLESGVERYAAALSRLEAARIELDALDRALSRSVASEGASPSWAALLAYPRFLANATIGELLAGLSELEQQRRVLAQRRAEGNLELRAVTDQIRYLESSLVTVATDYRAALRAEIDAVAEQVAGIQRGLTQVPSQAIELGRRQRDLRVLSEMVIVTEQRLRQEELRQALTFANVQVIDPPALYDRPIWPRRKLGPAIALMIAAGTALLGMVVVDRADGTVHTAAQVRAALGAPVWCIVSERRGVPEVAIADAEVLGARFNGRGPARLLLADLPGGAAAERAHRALRGHIEAGHLTNVSVDVAPAIDSFGAASRAAANDVPLLMVVELGTSSEQDIAAAAALLREADARIGGAILYSRRNVARPGVWV